MVAQTLANIEKHPKIGKSSEDKTLDEYIKNNHQSPKDKHVARILHEIERNQLANKVKDKVEVEKKVENSAKKIAKLAKDVDPEDKYKGDIADQYDAEFENESKAD